MEKNLEFVGMVLMAVPHKPVPSPIGRKVDRGKRVVTIPEIKVVIGKNGYGGSIVADAHFAIRRGCYQYLRWRDGKRVKELYLGKLTKHATQGQLAGRGRRISNGVVRKG